MNNIFFLYLFSGAVEQPVGLKVGKAELGPLPGLGASGQKSEGRAACATLQLATRPGSAGSAGASRRAAATARPGTGRGELSPWQRA